MNKMNLSVACIAAFLTVGAQAQIIQPLQASLAPLALKASRDSSATEATRAKAPAASSNNPGDRYAAADAIAEIAVTGSDAIIPAVFDGDRVRTRIQFTNVDTLSSSVSMTFANPDGYGTRFNVAELGPVMTVKVNLSGKGSYEVVTMASGDFRAGWAVFSTTGGRVVAQTTIEQLDSNGVWQASTTPAAHAFARQVTVRFDHRRGWDTQLILVNCNSLYNNPVTVTVRNQNGVIIHTERFTLDSLTMGALISLREIIGSAWTAGTVELYVPTAVRGGIAAVALRFNDSGAFESVSPQTVTGWVN